MDFTATTSEKKKFNAFAKSVFSSFKNMKKGVKMLAISWTSAEDKKALKDVATHLKKLGLIEFNASFNSIKMTLTSFGQSRISQYNNWYD